MTDTLPTARTTLRTGYVLVFCNSCRHQADADLQAIVVAGRGDVPLTALRFRCSQCGIDRTDLVVTSQDNPQPWWGNLHHVGVSKRVHFPLFTLHARIEMQKRRLIP